MQSVTTPRSSEPRFVKVKRADYHFSVTVGTKKKKRGRGTVEVSLCAPARSTQNKQMHSGHHARRTVGIKLG